MTKRKTRNSHEQRYNQASTELARLFPQVYGVVQTNIADFDSLRLYQRGEDDFLGVLKKFDSDGTPVVLFGVGVDFVTVMLSIEAAISANRWRTDKPPPWANNDD